jgi:hypothetical protein
VLLERLLTCAALRLNGRDSIRERSGCIDTTSSFCLGSFKAAYQGNTSESTTPASVSVSTHRSAITDYTPSRHDSNVNSSLPDVEKQVRLFYFLLWNLNLNPNRCGLGN